MFYCSGLRDCINIDIAPLHGIIINMETVYFRGLVFMQHIVFEVHAYVIALSKTVSLCSTSCLKCMLMLLLCQRLC